MTKQDAQERADALILQLILNQPQLITPPAVSEKTGESVAAFIMGMRNELVAMYMDESQ